MYKNLFFLFISILFSNYLFGQAGGFSIVIQQHDLAGDEGGIVQITATGTAGPFSLAIEGFDEDFDLGREWLATGLSAGEYIARFSTANGNCLFTKPFEILNCPEITITANSLRIEEPSSCVDNDGVISARWFRASPGSDYTYAMVKDGEELTSESSFSQLYTNLSPGRYCVVATQQDGCFGTLCFDLGNELFSDNIEADIQETCGESASGEITVYSFNGTDLFNFRWSTGAVNSNSTTLLDKCPIG